MNYIKKQRVNARCFSSHETQGCSCVSAEQIDDVGLSPTSTPEKSTSIPYTQPSTAATTESMAEITIEINFFLLIVCLLYVYLPRTRQHWCGYDDGIICTPKKAMFYANYFSVFLAFCCSLLFLKNAVSNAPHSSFKSPPCTSML